MGGSPTFVVPFMWCAMCVGCGISVWTEGTKKFPASGGRNSYDASIPIPPLGPAEALAKRGKRRR